MMEHDFGNLLKFWGPGIFLVLVILYGLFVLTRGIGFKIVSALEKPADALTQQAQSMDRLTNCIENFFTRDQSEHREIIILQKVILEKIEYLRSERDDRN